MRQTRPVRDRLDHIRTRLAASGGSSSDFDLNPDTVLPSDRVLRDAGVLAPVVWQNDRLELILTKRSSALKHHPLPPHETITGFQVTPVIGFVTRPFEIVPEAGEVEEVFAVPLDHVLNPDSFLVHGRRWRGKQRYYYAVPFGPYYIWGATARMLRAWADRMTP